MRKFVIQFFEEKKHSGTLHLELPSGPKGKILGFLVSKLLIDLFPMATVKMEKAGAKLSKFFEGEGSN